MLELRNKTQNDQLIAAHVEVAEAFLARLVGLLGRSQMPTSSALWIHSCNSIHTWFMKFSLDLIFVDRDLKVVRIYEGVSPFRIIWPIWSARSVFELPAGSLKQQPTIHLGDQLYVRS
jgi:uncharacterized membrane protein (UPF0127 family)